MIMGKSTPDPLSLAIFWTGGGMGAFAIVNTLDPLASPLVADQLGLAPGEVARLLTLSLKTLRSIAWRGSFIPL